MKLAAGPHYLLRAVISSGLCCTPKRTFVWAPGSPLYSTINHSSSIHLFIPLYSRDIISFLLFCTFGRIGIFTEQQIIWIFALKPTGWDVSLCVRHWLIKYEYTYYIFGTETWHGPLHLLHPGQAWFSCENWDYLWEKAKSGKEPILVAYLVEKWSHKRCCVPVVTYQVRIPKISQRVNSLVGSRSAHCEVQLRVENKEVKIQQQI